MKNVRRTEVDWCHILVTPGVGKAGVAASTEPPFVTNRTNYFEATKLIKMATAQRCYLQSLATDSTFAHGIVTKGRRGR